MADRSGLPMLGQLELGPRPGESSIIEPTEALRDGIIMPLCVIIGEESGDDCSARVWRLDSFSAMEPGAWAMCSRAACGGRPQAF
ncbi:hypothetical protein M8818_001291 [Zalaria obscura]|uniref:Uncharacterized protein n=1 Tax=Zalaria obscura TaxID=2024903 RepID=A0ACC3SMS5_9PEZI